MYLVCVNLVIRLFRINKNKLFLRFSIKKIKASSKNKSIQKIKVNIFLVSIFT